MITTASFLTHYADDPIALSKIALFCRLSTFYPQTKKWSKMAVMEAERYLCAYVRQQ